jgi:GDP-L-fucose synthase
MKIIVTGGTGMVGSGFGSIKSAHEIVTIGSKDYDLRRRACAFRMISDHRPDAIIHLAARVGGVKGNTDFVADFFSENIQINTNVLDASLVNNHIVKKVVSLLSTCVYPDKVNYPLTEDQIHNGAPHVSNFGYAYSKRMLDVHSRALRQQHGCNFICAVPNNLYGPHDNFDLENGHVIPAIIRKVWEAKATGVAPVFWSDGSALREFTYAPDIATILLHLLHEYNGANPINIGIAEERNIKSVVKSVCKNLDYAGDVVWDKTKPAGQHRKPSSNAKLLATGWSEDYYTSFEDGLEKTCNWFIKNYPSVRGME